jgi:hypothetical protein
MHNQKILFDNFPPNWFLQLSHQVQDFETLQNLLAVITVPNVAKKILIGMNVNVLKEIFYEEVPKKYKNEKNHPLDEDKITLIFNKEFFNSLSSLDELKSFIVNFPFLEWHFMTSIDPAKLKQWINTREAYHSMGKYLYSIEPLKQELYNDLFPHSSVKIVNFKELMHAIHAAENQKKIADATEAARNQLEVNRIIDTIGAEELYLLVTTLEEYLEIQPYIQHLVELDYDLLKRLFDDEAIYEIEEVSDVLDLIHSFKSATSIDNLIKCVGRTKLTEIIQSRTDYLNMEPYLSIFPEFNAELSEQFITPTHAEYTTAIIDKVATELHRMLLANTAVKNVKDPFAQQLLNYPLKEKKDIRTFLTELSNPYARDPEAVSVPGHYILMLQYINTLIQSMNKDHSRYFFTSENARTLISNAFKMAHAHLDDARYSISQGRKQFWQFWEYIGSSFIPEKEVEKYYSDYMQSILHKKTGNFFRPELSKASSSSSKTTKKNTPQ